MEAILYPVLVRMLAREGQDVFQDSTEILVEAVSFFFASIYVSIYTYVYVLVFPYITTKLSLVKAGRTDLLFAKHFAAALDTVADPGSELAGVGFGTYEQCSGSHGQLHFKEHTGSQKSECLSDRHNSWFLRSPVNDSNENTGLVLDLSAGFSGGQSASKCASSTTGYSCTGSHGPAQPKYRRQLPAGCIRYC